jgi:hypothetical protein
VEMGGGKGSGKKWGFCEEMRNCEKPANVAKVSNSHRLDNVVEIECNHLERLRYDLFVWALKKLLKKVLGQQLVNFFSRPLFLLMRPLISRKYSAISLTIRNFFNNKNVVH